MEQEKTDMDIMKQLKSHTSMMDFARNQHLKDYYPMVHELLEDIN